MCVIHIFIYHLVTWSLSNSACWFFGEAQNGRMFAGAKVVNAGLGGVTESPPGGETPCSIGEFGTFIWCFNMFQQQNSICQLCGVDT